MLKIYNCKICNLYNTTKQHYNLHCSTIKHINNNKIKNNIPIQYTDDYIFKCEKCNKKYKSNKGLWQHKKKCNLKNESNDKLKVDNQQKLINIDKLLKTLTIFEKKYIINYLTI
jgi:hypothetical protein